MVNKVIWKKYGDIMKSAYSKIVERREGKTKPLKTKWESFNKIGMNGIEWNSLWILSSRPGVGKTLILNTLTRDIQEENRDQDFSVLSFQFEMLAENIGIRELSAATRLNTRYIQSAKDDGMPPLSEYHLKQLEDHAISQEYRQEYIVDKPMTVRNLISTVYKFYNLTKKPFIVTLDHTLLIMKDASEKSKQESLENLATALTAAKNDLPVVFFILSQLNRTIDNAERQRPGMLSNYPTDDDIYGSDFLMQCADVVLVYNRPAKYNLSIYGPNRYEITPNDKYLLALHVLKNRFGELSIQWYQAEYEYMSLHEREEPNCKNKF